MYAIYTKDGNTWTSLTEQEFVTIRSILQFNSVPHQWVHTNI
jgi:hypothetical protein